MRQLTYLFAVVLLCYMVCSYPTFDEYCVQFNKVYGQQQKVFRKGVYDAKIESFANITTFVPGVNNFTDWTQEEFKAFLTLQTLPNSQRVSNGSPLQSRLGAPVSVDWRNQGIVTSIKDQASCGACWAFTSAALMQSYLIQNGKQPNGIDLSQQFLLQCTRSSSCTGGYIQYGLDAIKQGIPTQSQYPYSPSSGYGSSICSAKTIPTSTARTSYYDITDNQLINLVQYRPVAVAVASTGWSSYSSGTLSCSSGASVDHAVVVVGYTASAYIIKNSWGTSWGINGYGLVTRSSSSNCQITSQAHTLKASEYSLKMLLTLCIMVLMLIL